MRRQRPNPVAWTELLRTGRAMRAELRGADHATARAIARFGNDHRGARAWLRELA